MSDRDMERAEVAWLRNEIRRHRDEQFRAEHPEPVPEPEPNPRTGNLPCGDVERLLTTEDWMLVLGIGREGIYGRVRRGQIPKPFKVGQLLRWKRSAMDVWLAERGGYGGL